MISIRLSISFVWIACIFLIAESTSQDGVVFIIVDLQSPSERSMRQQQFGLLIIITTTTFLQKTPGKKSWHYNCVGFLIPQLDPTIIILFLHLCSTPFIIQLTCYGSWHEFRFNNVINGGGKSKWQLIMKTLFVRF